MLFVTGIIAIPKDPKLIVSDPTGGSSPGRYLNFKAVSQDSKKTKADQPTWHHWDCAMWVPEDRVEEMKNMIKPQAIFLIEHAYLGSYPVQDGKFHNTKVRLEWSKLKQLQNPLWPAK